MTRDNLESSRHKGVDLEIEGYEKYRTTKSVKKTDNTEILTDDVNNPLIKINLEYVSSDKETEMKACISVSGTDKSISKLYKTDKNKSQLQSVLDVLTSVSDKGKNRNVLLLSSVAYFDKLFNDNLLYKLQGNDWKTAKNQLAQNHELLDSIYNVINDNNHNVKHYLKKDV